VNQKFALIVIPLVLLLGACASSDKKPRNIDEYLAVQVSNDHIKHFSYSAEVSAPSDVGSKAGKGGNRGGGRGGMAGGRGGGRGGMKGGSGRPDPEQMQKKMEKKFDQRLAEKLEELQYCREGYEILDKSVGRGYAQYRGNCNELANKEDIKKFKTEQPGAKQQAS
jgi:hypothetical protein